MKKFPFIILLLAASALSMDTMAEESASSPSPSESSSALQDLQNANQDGQEAVNAPSDEKAKSESNETFDTPHSDTK